MKAISLKGSGVPSVSGLVGAAGAAIGRNATAVAVIGVLICYLGLLTDSDFAMIAGALTVFTLDQDATGKGGES